MKAIKKRMSLIMLSMALIISLTANCQKSTEAKKTFIRVYDLNEKKINKGHIVFLNDSILGFKKNNQLVVLKFNNIGLIKTKRSAGNNVLTGASIGAATGAILGITTADPDAWIYGYTAGEGAAYGIISGGVSGAAIGGITILFKNSKTFIINGDESNWKSFMQIINK